LTSIDLEPLRNCPKLELLYLAANPFEKIDLSPLFSCPVLGLFSLNSDIELVADAAPKDAKTIPPAIQDLKDKITWQE
jgi:hypothetical protein